MAISLGNNVRWLEGGGETVSDHWQLALDVQLGLAKEAGSNISEFHMEGITKPIKGPWVVKDVGYDVVLLEGPEGLMTVKMDVIVSILVEPKKGKELQVENVVPVAP